MPYLPLLPFPALRLPSGSLRSLLRRRPSKLRGPFSCAVRSCLRINYFQSSTLMMTGDCFRCEHPRSHLWYTFYGVFFVNSEVTLKARVFSRGYRLWALVGLAVLGLVITTNIVGTHRYASEASLSTGQIGPFRPSRGQPIFGERVSSREEICESGCQSPLLAAMQVQSGGYLKD